MSSIHTGLALAPILALADSTAFAAGMLVVWAALAVFLWWLARTAARLRRRAPGGRER